MYTLMLRVLVFIAYQPYTERVPKMKKHKCHAKTLMVWGGGRLNGHSMVGAPAMQPVKTVAIE